MPVSDRKLDDASSNHDSSSSTTAKLHAMRPDNMPINLVSRYETATFNHLTSLNRFQAIVRSCFIFLLSLRKCVFSLLIRGHQV